MKAPSDCCMLSMLLFVATVVVPCEAMIRLKVASHTQMSAALQELQRAEADDMRFWTSEWAAMRAELTELSLVASASVTDAQPRDTRASPKGLKLNPKSVADLAPALAMLKGLYEDGKERIGKLNAREKDSKDKFAEKEKQHKARIEKIELRFKNHTLSAEFRTNETRDETRLWSYWERVRERQHKQYRTGLKIQHATLEKVKKMIDMYEKTISGKGNAADVQKMLKKIAPPEIVFLQEMQHSVIRFCKESLLELHAANSGTATSPTTSALLEIKD